FYAPADGVIVRIQKFRWSNSGGPEYDDYHFTILHTNTFQTFLGHVYDPDPAILSKAGQLNYGDNAVFIRVKAGQVIGRGTTPDFGVFDRDKPNTFEVPDRYKPVFLYAQPPCEYYPSAMREEFHNKITGRIAEPRCGRIAYDSEGGLMGNWFTKQNKRLHEMEWNDMFSIAPHYLDPRRIEIGFSKALWDDIDSLYGEYLIDDKDDFLAPSTIQPGQGPVVYHLKAIGSDVPNKIDTLTLLVELETPTQLKAELFASQLANPSFTEKAVRYYR
ncbi:MAG: M23 family metallopeptidase, partial [Rectinema sp.]|nr:M23 family metallopeptidase [Rectinema sp.]